MPTATASRSPAKRRGSTRAASASKSTRAPRPEERRASPRISRQLAVAPLSGKAPAQVFAGEIGLGGASWRGTQGPTQGEVEVRFRLPELGEVVRARAEIARTRRAGKRGVKVSVRFVGLSGPEQLALSRFLAEQSASGA
jgi:hypothetical protein